MSGIVCAIRGGPESQQTIARAISLAQSSGLPLHFLYVVNLEFLSRTSGSRVQTISAEMEQLGKFILLAAQTSAAALGVSAFTHVRHGKVDDEIINLCQDVGASFVVVGWRGEREQSLLTRHLLEKFSQRITDETEAIVVMSEERA